MSSSNGSFQGLITSSMGFVSVCTSDAQSSNRTLKAMEFRRVLYWDLDPRTNYGFRNRPWVESADKTWSRILSMVQRWRLSSILGLPTKRTEPITQLSVPLYLGETWSWINAEGVYYERGIDMRGPAKDMITRVFMNLFYPFPHQITSVINSLNHIQRTGLYGYYKPTKDILNVRAVVRCGCLKHPESEIHGFPEGLRKII
ncbi:hypothetical protein M413DRAFT_402684 [Hebeloma cylindrosporum]|uniref:Uncharacterized protein n=1 Tax=Hebeloma cylindrosporum TaxID=76867 RepID=A0A0C2YQQ7_HEBCY|nr:hypothetical protein M413DRAFT_402684 [Hebeloma cylindrosporum h7]